MSIRSELSRAQAAATCEPAVGPPGELLVSLQPGRWSVGHSEKLNLNGRVAAQVILHRDTVTGRTHSLVLVERGRENWRGAVQHNESSARISGSGREVTGTTSVMFDGVPVNYALGADSSVARFMGKSYPLAEGNVLLLDRVDEKDSTTVQVGGCVALSDEGTVFQTVLRLPAVAAFVGPVTYPFPPG